MTITPDRSRSGPLFKRCRYCGKYLKTDDDFCDPLCYDSYYHNIEEGDN